MPAPAPRVSILFARDADRAVVFRRGPSDWFHLLAWSTDDDHVTPGAWVRGRVYPERGDLSPDGELLVLFVSQARKHASEHSGAWTAVSRAPWLRALALWPQHTTYGGGGRFVGRRELVLRGHERPHHPDHPPRGLDVRFGRVELHAGAEPRADWSGVDRLGRAVTVRDGRILREGARGKETLIADLRELTPAPQPAPTSASRPLGKR